MSDWIRYFGTDTCHGEDGRQLTEGAPVTWIAADGSESTGNKVAMTSMRDVETKAYPLAYRAAA